MAEKKKETGKNNRGRKSGSQNQVNAPKSSVPNPSTKSTDPTGKQ